MIIIADSSSTRTEWVIVDGNKMVERANTGAINPFFLTRREISHIIRLELPPAFFRRRWDHVYFYGAGCSNPEKIHTVEQSLVAQFKTPSTVGSDLLGASRGLLVHSEGLACILSTGANSCHYDGEKIVKNVRPCGYILGDEGSNSYLGKRLVSDILKGIAPAELEEAFFKHFRTNADEIMDLIYTHPQPNLTLTEYSNFLADHIDHPYCHDLVYDSLMTFFERNISGYDYHSMPLSFVGKTGITYRAILDKVADEFGATIAKVAASSLPGLIEYHASI